MQSNIQSKYIRPIITEIRKIIGYRRKDEIPAQELQEPEVCAPIEVKTPRESISEVLGKINELRREVKSHIYENRIAWNKHNEINSMLDGLPHSLFLWEFSVYRDYAEFWGKEQYRKLYSNTKGRAESISEKYGLEFVPEDPEYPVMEIRFRDGDNDILYINHNGQLNVFLEFPRIEEVLEDILFGSEGGQI